MYRQLFICPASTILKRDCATGCDKAAEFAAIMNLSMHEPPQWAV